MAFYAHTSLDDKRAAVRKLGMPSAGESLLRVPDVRARNSPPVRAALALRSGVLPGGAGRSVDLGAAAGEGRLVEHLRCDADAGHVLGEGEGGQGRQVGFRVFFE